MRTLAIDLGARRVGLALSDPAGQLATPHAVLTVSDFDRLLELLADLIHRERIERLVVGLPLNMDGTLGPAARQALAHGQKLAQRFGIPVLFVDERLSSFDAAEKLTDLKRRGQRLTRGKKKQRLDALAAASFLQAFLDDRLPALHSLPASDSPPNRP